MSINKVEEIEIAFLPLTTDSKNVVPCPEGSVLMRYAIYDTAKVAITSRVAISSVFRTFGVRIKIRD